MSTDRSANHVKTIDADGHVLEPRDVWLRYLEPGLRDRAIRMERDADVVDTIRERIAGLPADAQRKVLGENALRFYGLSA